MKTIIIGGGAAGMMAAGVAASNGNKVILIEKNKTLGKKLAITGKGRCNVTNACDDVETLIRNVPQNGTFLYSAFYTFTNAATIRFFEELRVPLKVERGERVFPTSDKSADIVNALRKFCANGNVEFKTAVVSDILTQTGKISGAKLANGEIFNADKVIIATGGLSYPQTGSTGDGYRFARAVGHTIVPPKPSLVPLETTEKWVPELMGLSLKNIAITLTDKAGKTAYTDFGEMIFTHFGVSGPVVLSASAHARGNIDGFKLHIDLKPALTHEQLDLRIQRDFLKYQNKDFKNCLVDLLPQRLIDVIIKLSNIPPELKTHSVTREQRGTLASLLKSLTVTIKGFRPIDEAIITSGGVSTKEIDPSTMQSKLIEGLYFCGEVIDVDAYTGGFNLQIAFSTAYLAGQK
ncbi:MAG: NAD(P)/FAD-dependent oxidoreductase [Oscillospiraceae bacterium]|nr:NAD(P)/FAD-dependent oxidoreductase [Oscillospiraceae bacterium]